MSENHVQQQRDRLISEHREIIEIFRVWQEEKNETMPDIQYDKLDDRMEKIRAEYFGLLPQISVSYCPFCHRPLNMAMDPWGVDGFWWQGAELVFDLPVSHCEHFVLIQGAVHLNELPPQGGHSEALTGPEQPFVVPHILEKKSVQMIVSRLPMSCGYTAYPLVYYALEKPHPSKLMETWRNDSYGWETENGQRVWSISSSPWDFNLEPWVNEQKVGWLPRDVILDFATADVNDHPNPSMAPIFGSFERYLHRAVTGRKTRLSITSDCVFETAVPDGSSVNPFE